MKQNANESYQDFKLRRQVENEATETRAKGWWFWQSGDKGTYQRTAKPEIPRPKRQPLGKKAPERHRKSGAEKRRDKANIVI